MGSTHLVARALGGNDTLLYYFSYVELVVLRLPFNPLTCPLVSTNYPIVAGRSIMIWLFCYPISSNQYPRVPSRISHFHRYKPSRTWHWKSSTCIHPFNRKHPTRAALPSQCATPSPMKCHSNARGGRQTFCRQTNYHLLPVGLFGCTFHPPVTTHLLVVVPVA